MMEDWRFRESPYVESGGLKAYAGAPLRLQHESGDCVALGSLCVASSKSEESLTAAQQSTLVRLADWIVSDIVQCARARRQRERRHMTELISKAQRETDVKPSEEPVLGILRTMYPDATVHLQSAKTTFIEIDGRDAISISDLEDGLWEDIDYLDDFVAKSNHLQFPSDRTVRIIASPCESISGPSLLVVASRDFRLVFDDVDAWFVQTCAVMLSQMWNKRLLAEAMKAKEKFLRGITHQLRTPIHGILGSVELLAEDLKSRSLRDSAALATALLEANLATTSSSSSVYLDTIKAAGRDLILIVNSMITLNRWEDVATAERHYSTLHIDELMKVLANEVTNAISGDTRYKASVFFSHNVPRDCEGLQTDLGLLKDSLVPLIINAIQSTPGGLVAVTASMGPDFQGLVVDIEDTGRGIHPDDQERIFEPWEKVDIHSTGAGLGLTLASKFSALLNGSVVLVSSDVNRGSHFRATFREVETVRSAVSLPPLASRLERLPSRFLNHGAGYDGVSLCHYFSRFLEHHAFTATESMEDCFLIFDYVPDLEKRREQLLKIPPKQVAICLVSTPEAESCSEQNSENVVYVREPFLPSTLTAALEQADKLLSEMKARVQVPRIEESSPEPPTPLATSDVSPTDKLTSEMTHLQISRDAPTNSGSDAAVSSTNHSNPAPPAKSNADSAVSASLAGSPRPTVLIVDDNVINLRIMQMYCKKRQLPFHCATDGLQAVEIFSKHQSSATAGEASPIELIFMDLQMPVCDGIEAIQRIRLLEKENNRENESTVFIVSGQDSPTDRTAADDAGANEFYVKPVGIEVLDRGVKRYFPAFKSS